MSEAFLHSNSKWYEKKEGGTCLKCAAHIGPGYKLDIGLCMSLPSCAVGSWPVTEDNHPYFVEVPSSAEEPK